MSRSNFCETITRKYYHEALLIFLLICIICTESITFVNSFTLLFSTTSGFRKVQSSSTSSGSNLAAVSINDNDSKKKQFEDDKNFAVTDFGTHHEDINLNFSDNDDDDGEQNSNNEYQIFKGKNKWLGGAIDSKDGSIYGIPSNSKDIICLRPKRKKKNDTVEEIEYQIHLIPLPKSVQEGKFKWLRGIICNGCLYGIPAWSNDGILKLDIEKLWKNYDESEQESHNHNHNDVVSIIPLPEIFHNQNIENKPHRWLWHGAALNSNKTAIYCIPSNAHQVLKVDLEQSECTFLPIPTPTTDKTTYPSTPLEQTNKWYGGILGNDNAIYGIPYSAANVLRIDANTDTVSLLGDYGLNEYNWHGGIKSDRNGCIYCFPAHHSHVLKIDTNIKISHDASKNGKNDCRLSLVPIHRASYDKDEVTRYKWLGGSLGADGNIYGMPSDASSILRIDTTNNVATTFGIVSGEKNKWQGGILSNDGKIYAIPSNAKHILCIDTAQESASKHIEINIDSERSDINFRYDLLGNLPGIKDKWQGGFVGIDGLIYCIPENFDKVMKVTPTKDPDEVGITFL